MNSAVAEKLAVTAVTSLLHESAGDRGSLSMYFRGEPVLAWTMYRLSRCEHIAQKAILCWEDQLEMAEPIAAEFGAICSVRSPRISVPQIEAINASRRWADGWRGGLLNACAFDRGFHAGWLLEMHQKLGGDAIVLVDPSAGLVDPKLIDQLVEHATENADLDFAFTPAAPGLNGVLMRTRLLEQLAGGKMHAGMLLAYHPDVAQRDPISSPCCVPIPAVLARTMENFTLDSHRKIDRISAATLHLNGELISTESEHLLRCISATPNEAKLPREVVLELTPRRISKPIYAAGSHLQISRPDLSLGTAQQLIDELAEADDARLVLGGVGDPMLSDCFISIVEYAHRAGIRAISLETDLLIPNADAIEMLSRLPLDVVSIFIPAVTAATYQTVMGMDGLKRVMDNLQQLVDLRKSNGRTTPILVPTFVKTRANFQDMEAWYDHWLKTIGAAVIVGPSDFSERIPDFSVAQMEPPKRGSCVRLKNRITVLSNGKIVSCEQDVLGEQSLGTVGVDSLAKVWSGAAAQLRQQHEAGEWNRCKVCAGCRDWHRP